MNNLNVYPIVIDLFAFYFYFLEFIKNIGKGIDRLVVVMSLSFLMTAINYKADITFSKVYCPPKVPEGKYIDHHYACRLLVVP